MSTHAADPIFAAIEAHRAANLDWAVKLHQHHGDNEHPECDAAANRESETIKAFWRTFPTRNAGWAAYFQYLQQPRWPPIDAPINPNPNIPESLIEDMADGGNDGDLMEWAALMEWAHRRLALAPVVESSTHTVGAADLDLAASG